MIFNHSAKILIKEGYRCFHLNFSLRRLFISDYQHISNSSFSGCQHFLLSYMLEFQNRSIREDKKPKLQ